jgi:hypothetical protein
MKFTLSFKNIHGQPAAQRGIDVLYLLFGPRARGHGAGLMRIELAHVNEFTDTEPAVHGDHGGDAL